MFARKVSLQLKLNSVAEFTRTIETDIIPLLHANSQASRTRLPSSSQAERKR